MMTKTQTRSAIELNSVAPVAPFAPAAPYAPVAPPVAPIAPVPVASVAIQSLIFDHRLVRPSPHCPFAVNELVRVNMKYSNGWWYCTSQSGQESNVHWSCLAPVEPPTPPTPPMTSVATADATPEASPRPIIVLDIVLYFMVHFVFSICMVALALVATGGNGLVVWAHVHQLPFAFGIVLYYHWKQQLSLHYVDEPPGPPLPAHADERSCLVRCAASCGKCHLITLVAIVYIAYYGAAIGLYFRAVYPLLDEENFKFWWLLLALSVGFQQFTFVTNKSIFIVQVCVVLNTYDISLREHTLKHRWGMMSGEVVPTVSTMESEATKGMLRTGVNYWSLFFKLTLAVAAIVLFEIDL